MRIRMFAYRRIRNVYITGNLYEMRKLVRLVEAEQSRRKCNLDKDLDNA